MDRTIDILDLMLSQGVDKAIIYAYFILDDESIRKDIIRYLRYQMISTKLNSHIAFEEYKNRGNISIGEVINSSDLKILRISRDLLNQHMLIVARSGFGKTSLLENLTVQLLEDGIPFTIFDFKREYRSLAISHEDVVVFPKGRFKVNILMPPPGVPLLVWEGYLSDLFAYNYGWYHGSRNLFQEYLHNIYKARGKRATIIDLYEYALKADRKYRRDYYEVVINRLYSITRNLNDFLSKNYVVNLPLLLESYAIIELEGVPRAEQNLIVEYLLLWTYLYRLYNGGIVNRLKHVFIFDEAKRIFDVTKEERGTSQELGIPLLSLIADEIRGFGEGLIISDQEPSKISKSVIANTAIKVIGCLGRGEDIKIIGDAASLPDSYTKLLGGLPNGFWIVRIAGYGGDPFIIKTYPKVSRKYIEDDILIRAKDKYIKEFYTTRDFDPSLIESYIMRDIIDNPHLNFSERCRKWGLNYRDFRRYINSLRIKGLIEEVEVPLGSGRPMKFSVSTIKGASKRRCNTKGGALHRFIVHLVHKLYTHLGFKCRCECKVGDYRVDILCKKGNNTLIFEVELSSQCDVNKLRFLSSKSDFIFVLLPTDFYPVYDPSIRTVFYDLYSFANKVREALLNRGVGFEDPYN